MAGQQPARLIQNVGDYLSIVEETVASFDAIKRTHRSHKRQEKQWWTTESPHSRKPDPEVVRLWFRGEYCGSEYRTNNDKELLCPEPSVLRLPDHSSLQGALLSEALTTPRIWFARETSANAMLRSRGTPIVESKEGFCAQSQLDWAFVAQHHGFPTRILDWSASALAALFFACVDPNEFTITGKGTASKGVDGTVWLLEPRLLLDSQEREDDTHVHSSYYGESSIEHEFYLSEAEMFPRQSGARSSAIDEAAIVKLLCLHQGLQCPPSITKRARQRLDTRQLRKNLEVACQANKTQAYHAIPIMPTQHLDRVIAQQSRFTLHPFRRQALSIHSNDYGTLTNNYLRPFIVPAKNKEDIASEIRRLGTNAFSLFPDLDHLAAYHRDMEWRYGF